MKTLLNKNPLGKGAPQIPQSWYFLGALFPQASIIVVESQNVDLVYCWWHGPVTAVAGPVSDLM